VVAAFDDVRAGIVRTLQELHPDIPVAEEPGEGTEPRRFFVRMLSSGQKRELGNRYRRDCSFDVHFYSPGERERVAESLYAGLESVAVPWGTVRGTGLRHEVVDGVLHVRADYAFRVRRTAATEPAMQRLRQEGKVK
jgi:hypothetical protein